MKICFVGPANSSHIVKWCAWFRQRGHEIHVISFTGGEIDGAKVHWIDLGVNPKGGDFGKLKYLLSGGRIRKIIREIHPDIVNAHYATSYGIAVALSGVKNYALSVWGSDIYDFPQKSPLHKALLKYSLKKAGHLFSTSQAMSNEARKYTDKPFEITPFGVDMNLFSPEKRNRTDNHFVVGTVKTLSAKYGIDYLVQAVGLVRRERPDIPVRLRIAGKGEDEAKLKALAKECGVDDITAWLGFIPQEAAAREWANFDLAVTFSSSSSESFGVAAVEAQSCGVPIIVSDVPGLMEATKPGETSVVVPRKNARALANAIASLYDHPETRAEMGAAGRRYVRANYELNNCFRKVEALYEKILLRYGTRYNSVRGGGGQSSFYLTFRASKQSIYDEFQYNTSAICAFSSIVASAEELITARSLLTDNGAVFPFQAGYKSRGNANHSHEAEAENRQRTLLVAVADYPNSNGGKALAYAHTRNLYYQKNGWDVTVLNFKARHDYDMDGIRVITMETFKKSVQRYRILILHAANLRNHYVFLKKYGGQFERFVFFFHGHEVLRINSVYSEPYDFVKRERFSIFQDMYDTLKLRVWRNFLPKIRDKSYFIFVSQWMYDQFLMNTGIEKSILENRSFIVYNSVGETFSSNAWDENSPKEFDFITIRSNLDNSKYAVDIVNRLAFNTPDMKFLLIGRGDYFKWNKKAPNLVWLDKLLTHHEIIAYLNRSRFALMPTRTDAQGLMMCEMAAYGMPVITSDIPVCHEVFAGFLNVDYIDNNDARLSLAQYRRISAKAMKDTRYFLETTCAQEVRILADLM